MQAERRPRNPMPVDRFSREDDPLLSTPSPPLTGAGPAGAAQAAGQAA
jgi:hypothetical protein